MIETIIYLLYLLYLTRSDVLLGVPEGVLVVNFYRRIVIFISVTVICLEVPVSFLFVWPVILIEGGWGQARAVVLKAILPAFILHAGDWAFVTTLSVYVLCLSLVTGILRAWKVSRRRSIHLGLVNYLIWLLFVSGTWALSMKAHNRLMHSLNGNSTLIRDLIPTDLEYHQSDASTVVARASSWLFNDTPQSFSEQIRAHHPGSSFVGASIRSVVPYTMENATAVFKRMAEDVVAHGRTLHIKDELCSLYEKAMQLRISKSVTGMSTSSGKEELSRARTLGFRNPFVDRAIAPKGCSYAVLQGVLVKYRPLVPLFSNAARVEMTLVDTGLAAGEQPCCVSFSKSVGCNILLGLSHPLPVNRLSRLFLRTEVSATGMQPGEAWGTLEVAFHFYFSSKPLTMGLTRSVVQYELPDYLFEVYANDPRQFHAELEQTDIDALAAIKKDIPYSSEVTLSSKGMIVKKASASGDDYPAEGFLDQPRPDVSPASRPPPPERCSTATYEMAEARLHQYRQDLEARRFQDMIRAQQAHQAAVPDDAQAVPGAAFVPNAGPESQAVRSGLPAVVELLTGVSIPQAVCIPRDLPEEVFDRLQRGVQPGPVAHVGMGAVAGTLRIASHPFAGSSAIALYSALTYSRDAVFTCL